MRNINVLSLFDGISCGQLALQRAGISVANYYASEIDKHAIYTTQKHFPKTIQLGDVTTIDLNNLPKIDLLIGGSPCQGFSIAGSRLNFDDKRSALFFQYMRILSALREKNPNVFFLLENVKMEKNIEAKISELLGVSANYINSNEFSAQNRLRLYWCNWGIAKHIPVTTTLADIVKEVNPNAVDLSVYRNKSQTILATIYKENAKSMIKRNKWGLLVNQNGVVRKLNVRECEMLQTLPLGYTNCISDTQAYKAIGNGWTVDVIVHIFNQMKNYI